jgi:hypothetical protein
LAIHGRNGVLGDKTLALIDIDPILIKNTDPVETTVAGIVESRIQMQPKLQI